MRRTLAAVFGVAVLGTTPAFGFSSIFAAGDSLSDGGNAFALTSAANVLPPLHWPPSPPAAMRFSNGPTAVEQLALLQGLSALVPSTTPGGTNYAVGGATTETRNYNYEIGFPPGLPGTLASTGMQSQVAQFLGAPPANIADTLIFLWGGPNDISLGFATGGPAGAAQAAAAAVQNLAGIVVGLGAAGARHFVVLNMPDLGSTPGGRASPNTAGLTALSEGFNAGLENAMIQIEAALPQLDIIYVDTFALLADATNNPGKYNLTNVTSPCLANLGVISAGCPGFLWFDETHPTTLAHSILANAVNAQLIPEPETWAMLAAGLLVLVVAMRRRRLA